MKDKNKEICLKIREIRKSLKLTQSQFAEICNLSEDSIGKIERCVMVPSLDTLYKISRSIKQPVEAILQSVYKDKFYNGLSEELTAFVDYLRSRPADDVKLLHELAVKILERRR